VARLVEKQYVEDVDEEAGFSYRYWSLVVETRGRSFGVRIYTDQPEAADVAVSPRPFDQEQHADLRAVAAYLAEHEGVRELLVIGDSGGFDELERVIADKQSRALRDA
jgi:hypothetical protein